MVFKVRLTKKIEVTHNGKTSEINLNEKANQRGQLDLENIYDQLKETFSVPDEETITGFVLNDGGAICHFDLLKGLRGEKPFHDYRPRTFVNLECAILENRRRKVSTSNGSSCCLQPSICPK